MTRRDAQGDDSHEGEGEIEQYPCACAEHAVVVVVVVVVVSYAWHARWCARARVTRTDTRGRREGFNSCVRGTKEATGCDDSDDDG